MGITVYIARTEHEASSQLKRIRSQLLLPEAAALGPLARFPVIGPQQVQDVRGLQTGRAIGPPFGIHQQRKLDAGLLAEEGGVVRVAQTNSRQLGAARLEFRCVFAQLRDVLPAENSSVVPQENDHGGARFPQASETNRRARGVGQFNVRERLAE